MRCPVRCCGRRGTRELWRGEGGYAAGVTLADPSRFPLLRLDPAEASLAGLLQGGARRRGGAVLVPSHDAALNAVLTRVPDGAVRRQVRRRAPSLAPLAARTAGPPGEGTTAWEDPRSH